MDMLPMITGAAHILTISVVVFYLVKFIVTKKKNAALLCLKLLGPLAALLIVLNAESLSLYFSSLLPLPVSTAHIYLASIAFLGFYEFISYFNGTRSTYR